jgi:hypothetical protein
MDGIKAKVAGLLNQLAEKKAQFEKERREPTLAERQEAQEILAMIDGIEAGIDLAGPQTTPVFKLLDPGDQGHCAHFGPTMAIPGGKLFARKSGDNGGFKGGIGEFFSTLVRNPADERLARTPDGYLGVKVVGGEMTRPPVNIIIKNQVPGLEFKAEQLSNMDIELEITRVVTRDYLRKGEIYKINFNRHFYQYTPPRPLAEIEADLKRIEQDIAEMLAEVTV